MKRTHTCGELRASDMGKTVTLNGWVHIRRNLGGVVFIDLRDRYGKTQVVFNPTTDSSLHELAGTLRSEYVISVTGTVQRRPEGNPELATGEIDVVASALEILNKAETPLFPIDDDIDASEDLRLKYRYLDLIRPGLQRNLAFRHRMYQIVHRYFDELNFIDGETISTHVAIEALDRQAPPVLVAALTS